MVAFTPLIARPAITNGMHGSACADQWRRFLGGMLRGLSHHGQTIYIGSLQGYLVAFEPEAWANEKPVP